jgi:hypothetical protein
LAASKRVKGLAFHVALFAVLVTIAVGPALAAADFNVESHQVLPLGGSTGTFTMSGDLSDAGTFHFTSFLFTSGVGSPVTTEHVSETWTGTAGTLDVDKQCRTEVTGFGATDACQALVTGGTGAYAGLHGTGSCTGFLDFITRTTTQTCEFALHE